MFFRVSASCRRASSSVMTGGYSLLPLSNSWWMRPAVTGDQRMLMVIQIAIWVPSWPGWGGCSDWKTNGTDRSICTPSLSWLMLGMFASREDDDSRDSKQTRQTFRSRRTGKRKIEVVGYGLGRRCSPSDHRRGYDDGIIDGAVRAGLRPK